MKNWKGQCDMTMVEMIRGMAGEVGRVQALTKEFECALRPSGAMEGFQQDNDFPSNVGGGVRHGQPGAVLLDGTYSSFAL